MGMQNGFNLGAKIKITIYKTSQAKSDVKSQEARSMTNVGHSKSHTQIRVQARKWLAGVARGKESTGWMVRRLPSDPSDDWTVREAATPLKETCWSNGKPRRE